MRSGYSAVKVEVFFDLSALNADGLFIIGESTIEGDDVIAGEVATDVTEFVYALSTARGRSRELDTQQTGTCQVRLRNYDGRFLPESLNAVSPYVGEIFPGKRVRVSMAANDEPIFAGRIDEWHYEFDPSGRVDAWFEAIDSLGILASMSFNDWTSTAGQSPGARLNAVLNRSEVDWGPSRNIGTGVSTLQSDAVSWGSNVLNYCALVAATERGLFFASRDDTLTFVGRDELVSRATLFDGQLADARHVLVGGFSSSTPTNILSGTFDGSAYTVRPDSWTETLSFLVTDLSSDVHLTGTSNANAAVVVSASGLLQLFQADDDAGFFQVYSEGGIVEVGRRYWLRSTMDFTNPTASTLELSTDGVTFFNVAAYWVGDSANGLLNLSRTSDYVVGHHITTGSYTTPQSRIYEWSRSYVNPTDGNRSVGFTLDDLSELPSVLPEGEPSGGIGSSSLTTFAGVVGVAGRPVDFDVLTDGTNGVAFSNIEVSSSSELLFNRVAVDREGGALQTVSSTASQEKYGVRSLQVVGLLLETDDQSLSLARNLLGQYSEPQNRVSAVTVILDVLDPADPADRLIPLHDMGDIVKVVWTPTGTSSQVEQLSIVEGKFHQVTVDGLHTVRYALSPADNLSGFIIEDARFGVIGQSKIAF